MKWDAHCTFMDESASSTPARDDDDQGLVGREAMTMTTMMVIMTRMVIK